MSLYLLSLGGTMKKTPSLKKTTSFRLVRNPLLLVIAVFTVLGSMPLQAMRAAAARRPHYWANWQKLGGAALGLGALDLAARGKKSLAYRGGQNLKKFAHWLRHGSEKGRLHDMKAHFGRNKKKYLAAVVIALIAEIARRRSFHELGINNDDLFGVLRGQGPRSFTARELEGYGINREQRKQLAGKTLRVVGEQDGDQWIESRGKSWGKFVQPVGDYLRARGPHVEALINVPGAIANGARRRREARAAAEAEVAALPAAPESGSGSKGKPLEAGSPEAVISAPKGSWVSVRNVKYRTHARDLNSSNIAEVNEGELRPVVSNEAGVVGRLDGEGNFVEGLVKGAPAAESPPLVPVRITPVEIGNVSEIAGLLQAGTLREDGDSLFTLGDTQYYLENPSNARDTLLPNSYYVYSLNTDEYGFLDKTTGRFTPEQPSLPPMSVAPY